MSKRTPQTLLSAVFCVAFVCCQGKLAAQESDLAADVKQIFRLRCSGCHGDTNPQADINILDRASYVGPKGQVVPGSTDESILYDRIATDDEDSRMPPGPRPALTIGEFETVRKWIEAGASEFPEDVEHAEGAAKDPALANVIGAEYVLNSILKHVEATPRDDRLYLRFFSSNHLLTSGTTAEQLKTNRHALAKAINHLSWQPDIVQPMAVDDANTVFAVDIRQLGWHETPFSIIANHEQTPTRDVNLYDQVLLEYPYGLAFDGSETYDRLQDVYLKPAGLIRPIPYVRIDWFVSTATQSPLYEDILQLPRNLHDLEQMLGVDADLNIQTYVARRAGVTQSGVSRNNRVVERHPARYGAYWKSFDFETSKGQQNIFSDPLSFHYAGGEMIWNLPNGLQAYLITDNTGNRILEAPTSIVTDKFAQDKVVRNGLACIRCHDRGMKRFADNIRPAFELLPQHATIKVQDVLRIYPTKANMDAYLDKDERRFLSALEQAIGEPQKKESLQLISRDFLDAALTLKQAAAELGLKDSSGLEAVFKLPQFTQLGLAGLSAGGVIRRDSWEDYYDRIVHSLGIGTPVAPVDGNSRLDHLSDGLAFGLKINTNKRSNVFSASDEMVITVSNDTGADVFIELIGTSTLGRKAMLSDGVIPLKNGASYRYPPTGGIKIRAQLGKELITVFANPDKFASGRLLRGENVADLFVHDFYQYESTGSDLRHNPAHLIKKTVRIETR